MTDLYRVTFFMLYQIYLTTIYLDVEYSIDHPINS